MRISDADAARLRELREALRALVAANHGSAVPRDALETLRREGAGVGSGSGSTPRGATELEPVGRGASTARWRRCSDILHEAQLSGDVVAA